MKKSKYYFYLNPHDAYKWTKCPKCDNKTKVRKYCLMIHYEEKTVNFNQLISLNKSCKFCPYCELIIGQKSEIETYLNQIIPNFGFRFNHFSNASFKQPNKGTNVVSLFAGLRYDKKGNLSEVQLNTPVAHSPYHEFFFGFGLKETEILSESKFPVYSLRYLWSANKGKRGSFTYGLDYFNNSSLETLVESSESSFALNSQFGATVGYSLNLSRIRVLLQQGFYLYNKYRDLGIMYTRLGLDYEFSNRIVCGAFLKSHYAKADHAEFSIGYRLY